MTAARGAPPATQSQTPGRHPLCDCGHTRASHSTPRRACFGGRGCACRQYTPRHIAPRKAAQ